MKTLLKTFIFCAIFAGCNSQEKAVNESVLKTSGAPVEITDISINLNGAWKDKSGRDVFLKDLAGKPRVVTMFYSMCFSRARKRLAI